MKRKVLIYSPSAKQARELRSMLASADCIAIMPQSDSAFEVALQEDKYDMLVYALEKHGIVAAHQVLESESKPRIVLTDVKFEALLSLLPEIKATHIIALNADGSLKLRELVSTLRKICDSDIFGVKHYLSFGTKSEIFHIRDSEERHDYIEAVVEFCKTFHMRQVIIKSVELFCEELLMNAIYDAPRDAEGRMLYNQISRKNRVILKPAQAARIECACDGEKLVVSISDPFGAMTWEVLQKFLMRCCGPEGKATNLSDEGGAGLGLYFCFSSVNTFVVNVDPQKRSEFIGIFNIAEPSRNRDSRYSSLHFFSKGSLPKHLNSEGINSLNSLRSRAG